MANQERFQQIYDQITRHPERHNQREWERSTLSCGTQYCVAGWALFFEDPESPIVSTAIRLIADHDLMETDGGLEFTAGQFLLGLDESQAWELFMDSENHKAVELVRRYANGELS